MTPVVRQRGMLPTAKLPTICALLLAVIIGSSNAVPPCRTDELHASTEDRLNPFSAQWDNSIAICALMRAENSQDVREFLQYHRHIGVDHVLLFDNNEDGGKQAADVRDFIADGFLSYYQIQGDNLQLGVYDICVEKARTQFAWLAAIDLDEFLVVKDEALRLEAKPLKRLMAQFRFKTGLWLQWRTYGPSDHDRRPQVGGPLKNYDQCILTQDRPNIFGKSIANMFWLKAASTAHGFLYRGAAPAYNDAGHALAPKLKGQILTGAYTFDARVSKTVSKTLNQRLMVHHYSTRSREDFDVKAIRGAGDHPRNVTFRDVSFFDDRKRLQKQAFQCRDTVKLGEECCYKDGQPFPPLPVPGAPIPETEMLYPKSGLGGRTDNCLLSERNPFSKSWIATTVLCVHVDDFSWQKQEMEAWIEHHKRIGVTKVALYLDRTSQGAWPDKGTQAYLEQQERSKFLEMYTLKDDSMRRMQDAMQHSCIKRSVDKFAFILFLKLGEFILLHKPTEVAVDLPTLLKEDNFRYSAGVVVPLYHYAGDPKSGLQRLSLAQARTCWQGDLGLTRTIANTFWLLEANALTQFRFNGDLLPVTDAGVQWPAAARHWPLPGLQQPLQWHGHRPVPLGADMVDPLVGMGSRLRVVAPDVIGDTLDQCMSSPRRSHMMSTCQKAHLTDVCVDVSEASRLLQQFLQLEASQ